MTQIFVFTAGDPNARAHLADSISRAVPASWLDEALPVDEAAYIRSLLSPPNGFFAWGAVPGERNVPMWESMQVGDAVLTVYDNHYHFVSSVIGKLHSPDLASRIWGTDDQGKTWEYMYLLSEPQAVNVPVLESPATTWLSRGYRGFTRISDAKVLAIVAEYGSVAAFLDSVFGASPPPTAIEAELAHEEAEADKQPMFDPENLVDGRKKVLAEIVRRRGQPKFRKLLLEAYGGRCAVTGCEVVDVLEAAHILAYSGKETNHVTNGLLLRADIHTLFDLGLIKVDELGVIHLDEALIGTVYESYRGKKISLPADPAKAPHPVALKRKFSLIF